MPLEDLIDNTTKPFTDYTVNTHIKGKKSTKKKSTIPVKSLEVILKETHKRYKKFGYTGYLAHVEIVEAWLEAI